LHQNTKGAPSALTTKARQFDRGSGEDATLSKSLRYHQSKCRWCELASPNCPEIQQNFRLAIKHGALSEDEVSRKLDLADFYLAAKNFDDAWSLYAEVLYRSYECSDLDRLLIAVKVLYTSIRFNLQGTAKDHLICLLFMDKESPRVAAKPLWMMHLLRGMRCQTRGDLSRATLHMQRARELGDLGDNISHQGRSLDAQRALISEATGRLQRTKNELDRTLPKRAQTSRFYRAALLQSESTDILLQWCLKQVREFDYVDMLGSTVEKPWTKVPSLQSFKDFERTALFCYLWKEYRKAQRTQLHAAPSVEETIVMAVKSLEQSLQIPAPMIFSTVSSMATHVETAGFPTVYWDLTLGQINRQATENLRKMINIYSSRVSLDNVNDKYANLFISADASLKPDIGATEEERQFRTSVQRFVRQFAEPQASLGESTARIKRSKDPREAYVWKIGSVRGTESVPGEENVKDNAPALKQSESATPTAEPQPAELPTDREPDLRPASCISVDMLATPRSSLSSSKASLRSFQRLGRVAESLLRRADSGANQLPSEAMNRGSHSSWSLRRLTGVSYLSGISGTPEDYEPEEDTTMEDAA
jgi:hypothetical protein